MRSINWAKVHKRYKEVLGKENYENYANPFAHDLKNNRWIISLSERDTGKTTNFLIVCLIIWWDYGYSTAYVRSDTQQLTYAKLQNLFNIVLEFDYVTKITDGKYNHIAYDRMTKTWHLCNTEGETIETQDEACFYGLSVHNQEEYKSTLNLPRTTQLIFDEFINQYTYKDDFVNLCHLCSTIFRHRMTPPPTIILLANTLTKYHFFFSELGIQKFIKYIRLDEVQEYVTKKGTHISVTLIKSNITKVKKEVNSLLYGFENPLLNSITGGEWAIENYPHLTRFLEFETMQKNVFIVQFLEEYFAADYIIIDNKTFLYFHEVNIEKLRDREIYTICDVVHDNEIPIEYILKPMENCINLKLAYYQNNEIGDLVKNVIDYFK